MPKFSVRGIWQRWRESYPVDGTRAEDAITVFTGVSLVFVLSLFMWMDTFCGTCTIFVYSNLVRIWCILFCILVTRCLMVILFYILQSLRILPGWTLLFTSCNCKFMFLYHHINLVDYAVDYVDFNFFWFIQSQEWACHRVILKDRNSES